MVCLLAVTGSITVQGDDTLRPFIESYCIDCHDGAKPEAGVRLEMPGEFASHEKLWREILHQLETDEMPPEGPYPSGTEMAEAISWIKAKLDSIDFESLRKIEPSPVRRLTKVEYRNTLSDLLGVDLRAGESLPPDAEGPSGFRNDRNALVMSAPEMEKFFDAAESAVEGWLGPEEPMMDRSEAEQWDRSTAQVSTFRNGVVLVHPDHEIERSLQFPVDGTYHFRLKAAAFEERCTIAIRIGDEIIAEMPLEKGQWSTAGEVVIPGFVRKGTHTLRIQSKNLVPQNPLPPNIAELVIESAASHAPQLSAFADETEPLRQAREKMNNREMAIQEAWEWLRAIGPDGDPREIDRFRRYTRERDEATEPARNEVATLAGLSRRDLEKRFLEQNRQILEDRAEIAQSIATVEWQDWEQHQGRLFVDSIEVSGPVFPKTKKSPSGFSTVEKLLPIAFRRGVSDAEIRRYQNLFRKIEGGEREKLRSTMIAILLSPEFLYRTSDERFESRQSYFLWLGPPDPEIEDVDAMLNDPRAESFYTVFAEDWLGIENLGSSVMPDRSLFPEFTETIAQEMKDEAVSAVKHAFRPGGSLLELIRAYELPAVLTVTSSPGRTNPVRRGAWVLDRLLGDPPGEALPDAGELPGDAGQSGLSLTEELKRHRNDPACARCHEKIDPIGFALENFDPLGRWQEGVIDSEIGGREGLYSMLNSRRDEVTRNMIRRLLSFAIGRQLTVHDEAEVRTIAEGVAEKNYESREAIRLIVQSELFQKS